MTYRRYEYEETEMTEDDCQVGKTLKEAFPPVDTELRRDLWPSVARRLNGRPHPAQLMPWYDWALLGLSASVFLFYPRMILVLAYHF